MSSNSAERSRPFPTINREIDVYFISSYLPDHNFQFSTFHFTFATGKHHYFHTKPSPTKSRRNVDCRGRTPVRPDTFLLYQLIGNSTKLKIFNLKLTILALRGILIVNLFNKQLIPTYSEFLQQIHSTHH